MSRSAEQRIVTSSNQSKGASVSSSRSTTTTRTWLTWPRTPLSGTCRLSEKRRVISRQKSQMHIPRSPGRKSAGFGTSLFTTYFGVDVDAVRDVIQAHLPSLAAAIVGYVQ